MKQSVVGKVQVRLMGFFSVIAPDGSNLRPKGQKPAAILAYLAYHRGREKTRERLIDLFWSDRAQKQGQDSLRQALYAIRTALGDHADSILDAGRNSILIRTQDVRFDLWNQDGSVNETLAGTFLEDLDYVSPAFDDWLAVTRRGILNRQISRAERLLAGLDLDEHQEEALNLSHTILALDPTNEPVARTAMRIYAGQDQIGRARSVFEEVREHLRADDFDVSDKTLKLLRSIGSGKRSSDGMGVEQQMGGMAFSPSYDRDIPIVEVISPSNEVQSIEETELCEDFFDRLISRMIQMPELRVRTQSMPALPREDSEYQLRISCGSRPSGPRIGLRLSSADGQSLWSDRADLEMAEETEQIQARVDSLVTQMLPALEEHIFRGITGEPTSAYGHYLVAKRYFVTASPENYMDKVVAHLHRATEIDPDFLPAYTNLIMSYNTALFYTRPGTDHSEPREKAHKIAQRLLLLNFKYANTHIGMAWCLLWKGKFDSAERSIRRAMELKPYEPIRLNILGTALVYLGHHDEGERYYTMAQERLHHDMDFQSSDYGELYYLKREYEAGLSWLEMEELRNPYRTLFWRAPTNAQLGLLKEARADVEVMVERFRQRWCGPNPFRPEDAIQWYCDMVPLRLSSDRENLQEGLKKAGLNVEVRNRALISR